MPQFKMKILLATQVTSAIAAFLLVLPTYWLGRMMFGPFAGFAAALIFQMLPVSLEVTSDGLTDGLYLLGFGSALMLGMRALRKPGIGGFLTTGLAIGCTYLVRPEGLIVAVALTIVVFGFALMRYWLISLSLARITALAVGTALPAIPYMVLIGGITNKPTGNELIPVLDTTVREGLTQRLDTHVQGPIFAAWYTEEDGSKPAWIASALFKETFKTFHYASMILALIGLIVAAQTLPSQSVVVVPGGAGRLGPRHPRDAADGARLHLGAAHFAVGLHRRSLRRGRVAGFAVAARTDPAVGEILQHARGFRVDIAVDRRILRADIVQIDA